MKKCIHTCKIENMPLQPSAIYSCPWQMSQSAFFPVKPSVWLHSDRKPRARQKLGNGPGVDKCPAPGQCKICKCPTPGTDKACKCPAVARGGGPGRRWNWLMHKTSSSTVVRSSKLELGGSCVQFSHRVWAIFSGLFGVRILLLPNDIICSDEDHTQNVFATEKIKL